MIYSSCYNDITLLYFSQGGENRRIIRKGSKTVRMQAETSREVHLQVKSKKNKKG